MQKLKVANLDNTVDFCGAGRTALGPPVVIAVFVVVAVYTTHRPVFQ